MSRLRFLVSFCLVLLVGTAMATEQLQKITLDPTASSDQKVLNVKQDSGRTLTLEFSLPFLNREDIEVEGEVFQALTIPDGGQRGAVGQASLPTFSKLIMIPDNAAVSVTVNGEQRQVYENYKMFPAQPDEGDSFAIDRAYYNGTKAEAPQLVEIGDPGIMHGIRVVPVTINPVSYDPASGRIEVTNQFDIEIDFSGTDTRNGVAPLHSHIAESFHNMYQDLVVNYRNDDAEVGPGSYLIICRNNSTVINYLQDLVDWRERQGYNVVLAHTGQTGTTTSSIKSFIQSAFNTYDPPLEFVTLVGDATGSYSIPCYFENQSGYGGEGDHYYTNLAGGDILADVHLGRLSIQSTNELSNIVNKIITYETNPPTSDANWFTRAYLTGDPGSSGITTIYVNQWVKAQLKNIGYTQIDTLWGGNFVSGMQSRINAGVSVYGYRGYWNMSGITSSHIAALNNGGELPFALIPTCDTGTFSDDTTCRSEAFLRASNGGGIGAIGTATTGTHTRYNNCYYTAVWDGAINGSDHRLGVAHSFGKINLYTNYYGYETSKVDIWSMWNNLMGDPATPMWTAFPPVMTVNYPSTIPNGVNSIQIDVSAGGMAVEDALVTLFRDGQLQVSVYTGSSGSVTIPYTGVSSGSILVTVQKYNHRPHLGSFNVGSTANYPAVSDHTVDDDNSGSSSGNNDGLVNPGESIELSVALRNYGTSSASNVTATLSSSDPYVTISDANESFGTIASGSTAWSGDDFDITIAANAPAGHVIGLDVTASSGSSNWTSGIELTVSSAAFDNTGFNWGGSGSALDPGESGTLTFTMQNTGNIPASGITATLASASPWISVTDGNGSYSNLSVGASGTNTSNPFAIAVAPDCFDGHLATFTVTFQFNGSVIATAECGLTVGTLADNDPLGPDNYGYYAFDNTDTEYVYCPTYNWVEIDPNYGGSGSDVGLSDFGWEQDDIELKTLPFDFQYYGETFGEISIASNGFIAFGRSQHVSYQNWAVPGPNSAANMIAPYWDNLYQSGSNRVYHWYDSEFSRYIIQWSRVRADDDGATQNIQLILLDPLVYPTPTGDGQFLMQYHTVSNTDNRDCYASVGIGNADHTDGIAYTFSNLYPVGAPNLTAGRAILFTTVGSLELGTLTGSVTNASNGNSPVADIAVLVVDTDQTITTMSDGSYSASLAPGTYTIRVTHPSFETVTHSGVEIVNDEVTSVNFSLTDILGPSIENTTDLPLTDDTAGPYVVDTNITDFSDIQEMHCYYNAGSGVVEATLTLIDAATGHYQAEIPGYPAGTQIQYWIEAVDSVGNESRDPDGSSMYSFWVLELAVAFSDDMESNQGWTVNGGSDTATTGIWVRGEPDGTMYNSYQVQTEYDHSPNPAEDCWVTGNAATDEAGADDVDGGYTTLLSPVFDLSDAMEVTVSYYRWYTNSAGSNPGQDYWQVQVNDGSGWVYLENTAASDNSWVRQEFQLDDVIELTETVQFRFIASDDSNGSLVEAALDDFVLEGYTIPGSVPVQDGPLPTRLALRPNHPNPFNPMTTLSFELPQTQAVSLRIFDVTGRLVRTVVENSTLPAGVHQYQWAGRDVGDNPVGSGVYFFVLNTETGQLTGKMTLLK